MSAASFDDARKTVEMHGYVVLKRSSYRAAQERQRIAEVRMRDAFEQADSTSSWARDCLNEERRLRDRCTFLYGAAMALGATHEDLAGPVGGPLVQKNAAEETDE